MVHNRTVNTDRLTDYPHNTDHGSEHHSHVYSDAREQCKRTDSQATKLSDDADHVNRRWSQHVPMMTLTTRVSFDHAKLLSLHVSVCVYTYHHSRAEKDGTE